MEEILLDDYEQSTIDEFNDYYNKPIKVESINKLLKTEHQLYDNMDFN